MYAQEKSEYVFSTEQARTHDPSITLPINIMPKHHTFTVTYYNIVFAHFALTISQGYPILSCKRLLVWARKYLLDNGVYCY